MGLIVYFPGKNSVFSRCRDRCQGPPILASLLPNPTIQFGIIPGSSQSSLVFRFEQSPMTFFEFHETEKDTFQVRPLRLLARLFIERDCLLFGFDAQGDGPRSFRSLFKYRCKILVSGRYWNLRPPRS